MGQKADILKRILSMDLFHVMKNDSIDASRVPVYVFGTNWKEYYDSVEEMRDFTLEHDRERYVNYFNDKLRVFKMSFSKAREESGKLVLWRIIKGHKDKLLATSKNLGNKQGVYWTWAKDSHYFMYGMSGETRYMIKALLGSIDDIDWQETVARMIDPAWFSEHEIKLVEGAQVVNPVLMTTDMKKVESFVQTCQSIGWK